MRRQSHRLSIAIVMTTVIALLALTPGPRSEHLEESGHDHEDALGVAVEAVHTTLPAHFDASSATGDPVCSACLLHAPSVVRLTLLPGATAIPPAVALDALAHRWIAGKPGGRLDLSRAPPIIVG